MPNLTLWVSLHMEPIMAIALALYSWQSALVHPTTRGWSDEFVAAHQQRMWHQRTSWEELRVIGLDCAKCSIKMPDSWRIFHHAALVNQFCQDAADLYLPDTDPSDYRTHEKKRMDEMQLEETGKSNSDTFPCSWLSRKCCPCQWTAYNALISQDWSNSVVDFASTPTGTSGALQHVVMWNLQ